MYVQVQINNKMTTNKLWKLNIADMVMMNENVFDLQPEKLDHKFILQK